ncbi:MAG: peptidylprolyl isomerase [Clostridia bacterium]
MSDKKVLAVVNGKEITQSDVEMLLRSIDPQRAAQFYTEEGKKTLLEELVNQELFYFDALEQGLEKEEVFKAEIERLKNNLLKEYSITRLLNTIKVEESYVAQYYDENKEQFEKPESISASHILVEDELQAHKVVGEINRGFSFEDAAKQYSSCPSNAKGGDLGYFTKGQMVPEFEEAAFAMNIGEISKPVSTQFGYHIIKLTDRKEGASSSFDEVKNQLTQQLTMMKQNEVYKNKCNELKKKYEVKINS